jgi:hypothetical protein
VVALWHLTTLLDDLVEVKIKAVIPVNALILEFYSFEEIIVIQRLVTGDSVNLWLDVKINDRPIIQIDAQNMIWHHIDLFQFHESGLSMQRFNAEWFLA